MYFSSIHKKTWPFLVTETVIITETVENYSYQKYLPNFDSSRSFILLGYKNIDTSCPFSIHTYYTLTFSFKFKIKTNQTLFVIVQRSVSPSFFYFCLSRQITCFFSFRSSSVPDSTRELFVFDVSFFIPNLRRSRKVWYFILLVIRYKCLFSVCFD